MTLHLAFERFMTVDEVNASGACPECIDEADDTQLGEWLDQASDLIAMLSGMKIYGQADLVARPCRFGHHCYCDCCHLDSIPFGDPKPIITEVLIDGVTVPDDEYDLHWGLNGWSLVRLGDGTTPPDRWPSSQRLHLADTEDNTFAVYVTFGVNVDIPMVHAAVLELVCDIASDVSGGYNNPNQLESGIIQATIGNATVQVDFDRLARLKRGEMGPALSKLLAVYAPGERSQQSAVYSPELLDGWNVNLRIPPVIAS